MRRPARPAHPHRWAGRVSSFPAYADGMIVTGMFVAEVARAANWGKLDVLGGVLDGMVTDAIGTDRPVPVTLVALVQRDARDDDQGTVTIDVSTPAGDHLARAEIEYTFRPGIENGFVYLTMPLPVAVAGRYTFIGTATGSDHSAALGLRFIAAEGT